MSRDHLLVVDDDPDVCSFIRSEAERIGYLTCVGNGSRRFDAIYEAFAPDAIVLDLAMRDRDGVEIMRDLAERLSVAQILIVSSFGPRVAEGAHRLGLARGLNMAGVVYKPISIVSLRRALGQLHRSALPVPKFNSVLGRSHFVRGTHRSWIGARLIGRLNYVLAPERDDQVTVRHHH